MSRRFVDREDAGRALAAALAGSGLADVGGANAVVLGLPRGGVPVAAVVAETLGAPLDVLLVRKIGVPSQPEVAMGAIASIAGSIVTVRNESVLRAAGPDARRRFDEVAARERAELERRQGLYRAGRPPLEVRGRDVILVDDGIATGATMRAAGQALAPAEAGSADAAEGTGPASVTVAVPVGPADELAELATLVDRVVCVSTPDPFWAVGQAYVDFTQTADDEVVRLLAAQAR
jgi:putative phosphoribosyl transferase